MLPVAKDERSLEELGRQAAVKVYGTEATKKELRRFAEIIEDGVKRAREHGTKMSGLIFFPDFHRLPPVGYLDVFGYYPSDPDKPSSLEFYRSVYGTPDESTIGEIRVTEVELPAGPSLRFHKQWKTKPGWKPSFLLHESVTYAIRPRRIPDGVVIRLMWQELALSAELVKSADAIAKALEIELLDEG
jgi:hypothetical protein